ncbi:MAG: TPM domain-containing protein, partial [Desulfitobacterium hafniense]
MKGMKPMKRKFLLAGLILLFLALAFPLQAATPSIPQPTRDFFVLDEANVLDSNTERIIVQNSAELEKKTKAQIVVVTVIDLKGYGPEEYALSILREWGIGDKKLNNGLLILVSPTEGVARIEVGYGLEGALPDAKTGQIQDEYMIPYFQEGDYNQGILNGYRAFVQEVAKEYQVVMDIDSPQALYTSSDYGDGTNTFASLPLGVKILALFGIVFLFYIDHRYFNGFIFGMIIGMLMRG